MIKIKWGGSIATYGGTWSSNSAEVEEILNMLSKYATKIYPHAVNEEHSIMMYIRAMIPAIEIVMISQAHNNETIH